jgi:D-alanine-D-alanine ligase
MSAASIVKHLDPKEFEVIPVGISKEGHWYLNGVDVLSSPEAKTLLIKNQYSAEALAHLDPTEEKHFDVAFPITHGKLGEDGALQGALEWADIPYVGSRVLGSAIGMDKEVAKRLAIQAGIPVTPYVCYRLKDFDDPKALVKKISRDYQFPLFVKPANAGSSEGVSKVHSVEELLPALELAFSIDRKILVEKAINAREIELAVLEELDDKKPPRVSHVAGEVVVDKKKDEFYSYDAKYFSPDAANVLIPADLSPALLKRFQSYAQTLFQILECEGFARVDFFLDKDTGEILFNEVNTLPGFTEISLFPKLFEASGLPYSELLTHLITLALLRKKV